MMIYNLKFANSAISYVQNASHQAPTAFNVKEIENLSLVVFALIIHMKILFLSYVLFAKINA
jgi:hypothetical protein